MYIESHNILVKVTKIYQIKDKNENNNLGVDVTLHRGVGVFTGFLGFQRREEDCRFMVVNGYKFKEIPYNNLTVVYTDTWRLYPSFEILHALQVERALYTFKASFDFMGEEKCNKEIVVDGIFL